MGYLHFVSKQPTETARLAFQNPHHRHHEIGYGNCPAIPAAGFSRTTLVIDSLEGECVNRYPCDRLDCVLDKVPGSDARDALEGVWYMLLLKALLGAVRTVPVLELRTCVNLDPGLVGPDPEIPDCR